MLCKWLWTLSLLTALLSCMFHAQERETFMTPDGQIRKCINQKECSSLVALLMKQRPLPSEVMDFRMWWLSAPMLLVCCPSISQTTSMESSLLLEQPVDVSNHRNLALLPLDICGPILGDKITNGDKTALFEFPWMALIGYASRIDDEILFGCGGTIINERYILTAAHCVTHIPSHLHISKVRLGEYDLSTDIDCYSDPFGTNVCADPHQDFDVEEIIAYPEFVYSKMQHDIGLIRLSRTISFHTDSIKPVCLPIGSDQTRNLDGMNLIVAGWGITEKEVQSDILLRATLPVTSVEECIDIYLEYNQTLFYPIHIIPKQICAGGVDRQDTCRGDSGGPLMYKGEVQNSLRFVQHGIVSFGPKPCANIGVPSVFTRVSFYMDWILNTIRP